MRKDLRFFVALALAGVVCARANGADAPERYAVLALIGDEMTIVTHQPATGSNLDTNVRQAVPLTDDFFDRDADVAVEAAVKRAVVGATTTIVTVSDPALTANSDALVDAPERLRALVAPIASQLGPDVRWLVLVTKHREDSRLRSHTGMIGSGKLVGLGFYIDRYYRMTRLDTGEMGRGFLAPYAYLRFSLVDLASGALVRTRTVAESTTLSSARSKESMNPWDTLTADEKTRALQGMVRRAASTQVPLLLAPG